MMSMKNEAARALNPLFGCEQYGLIDGQAPGKPK
jgi:hypothetical protein